MQDSHKTLSPLEEIARAIDAGRTVPFFDVDGDSASLTEHILRDTKEPDSVALFTCPLSRGQVLLQRARMRISRARRLLETEQKYIARFRLESQVTPMPDAPNGGEDFVKVKRVVTDRHTTQEMLEQTGAIPYGKSN